MALVSLKLSKEDKEKHGPARSHGHGMAMGPEGDDACEGNREQYPPGARLCLEGEVIARLDLQGVRAGAKVHLSAVGIVERVEAEAGKHGVTGICIQLTELEATPERTPLPGAEAMYGHNDRTGDSAKTGLKHDHDVADSANRLYGPTRNRS